MKASSQPDRQDTTMLRLAEKKKRGELLTMLTACNYPTALAM